MAFDSVPLHFGPDPQLELHAAAASISMLPIDDGENPRMEVRSNSREQLVSTRSDGERVLIDIGHGYWQGHVRLDLFLPQRVKARVVAEHGRMRAERFHGASLDLETGAGVIQLHDVMGEMRLRTGAGSITTRGCGGRFDVEAGAGSIGLDVVALDAGRHRVHSNVGAVRVGIATGVSVKIEASTQMGSVRNRYPAVNDAAAVMVLTTNMGAVKVKETSAAEVSDWLDVDAWVNWAERHLMDGLQTWRRDVPTGKVAKTAPEDNIRRVLEMVQAGTITAQDAEALLQAMKV